MGVFEDEKAGCITDYRKCNQEHAQIFSEPVAMLSNIGRPPLPHSVPLCSSLSTAYAYAVVNSLRGVLCVWHYVADRSPPRTLPMSVLTRTTFVLTRVTAMVS